MLTFQEKAQDFLAQQRIAVAGVSAKQAATGNGIYTALRKAGYKVFAVNPNADSVEGDPCYPDIASLPAPIDGLVIVTRPSIAKELMEDCVAAGIPRVWMHYNALFGERTSSVSAEATKLGENNGIMVLDGGCPLMFMDFGHRCMRGILGMMNKLPA